MEIGLNLILQCLHTHPLIFFSWIRPFMLHKFLIGRTNSQSHRVAIDENLQESLSRITFDIGDLVFWDISAPDSGHVAVITQRWAPQTFFGGFKRHPDTKRGLDTTWSEYLQDTKPEIPIEEQMRIFKGVAFNIWRYSRCESIGLPYLPRVVERSGSILYHGSRSINDTLSNYDFFTIVHIGN